MAAKDMVRQKNYGIADHAAESGRQRPPAGHRQNCRKSRRSQTAHEPEQEAPAYTIEVARRDEAPTEDREWCKQRHRRESQYLHHEIGGDRARNAKEIVNRTIGSVVQARILDRPGQERERQRAGAGNEHDASHFRGPPHGEGAQRIGDAIQGREAGRPHQFAPE
jgi:hypothetical protein